MSLFPFCVNSMPSPVFCLCSLLCGSFDNTVCAYPIAAHKWQIISTKALILMVKKVKILTVKMSKSQSENDVENEDESNFCPYAYPIPTCFGKEPMCL
jgi:hypothetical protein